jgi:hypothetical protein
VYALAVTGSSVHTGGYFTEIGGYLQDYLAGTTAMSVGVDRWQPRESLGLDPAMPNPASTSTTIRFSLPVAERVSLAVFDLQGRRVATLLDGELRGSGTNGFAFSTARLETGLYLVRLEAAGSAATRKLLIVH